MFAFNGRAPRAESWVKAQSSELIREISFDQRDMVREVLRVGLEQGRNPRSVALDLVGRLNKATGHREGGMLGLTSQQSQFVRNARAELEALNNGYFSRALRDKRYDGMVAKAIRNKTPLPAKDLNAIVGRYNDKMLKFRADTIARTEMINSLRAGRHEGYVQLLDSGKITDEMIEREWSSTGDSRTREDHIEMDGQTVAGIAAPFTAPDGSQLMFPGDTSLGADASQTIQCRCFETVRIRYV